MVKNLLSFAALAAMALTANAYELPLTSEDTGENAPLYAGWNSSYDQTTQTITYAGAWSGRGWWFGNGEADNSDPADFSAYTDLVISMEANIGGQIVIEYVGGQNGSFAFDNGATEAKAMLNPDYKDKVMQIYIQCTSLTADPTIKLIKAELVDNSGAEPDPVIWEGEYTASNWNSGAEINEMFVKAGDILAYTATAGSDDCQILMKNVDWKELLGSSKFQNSAIFDGVIEVVVTEAMLENAGGKFFLQGDGGMTITKVEKVGTYEVPEGYEVLNAGIRGLATNVFVSVPEDAEAIYVAFDAKPEWIQVCKNDINSWVTISDNEAATVVKEEEGYCMMSFPLTAENIADINAKNEIIYNGGGANYLGTFVKAAADGIQAVESEVDANAPAVYYNLQGIQIANPVAGQMYIVKQGNKVSKIIK